MKTALQLYSVRAYLGKEQMADTLARVHDMGYEGAEWPGLIGYSPEELAKITTDAGLTMFSLFISAEEMAACDVDLLRRIADVGVRYVTLGWLPGDRIAGGALFAETCEQMRRFGAAAGECGLRFSYHNHDFDLAMVGNSRALDILYDTIPAELLGSELDTCWLYSGGVDPVAYVKKYASRTSVIHLKDCVREGGRAGYRPLGMGVLDFDAILAECPQADWCCVEQDDPSGNMDAFACAKASADFLRTRLSR